MNFDLRGLNPSNTLVEPYHFPSCHVRLLSFLRQGKLFFSTSTGIKPSTLELHKPGAKLNFYFLYLAFTEKPVKLTPKTYFCPSVIFLLSLKLFVIIYIFLLIVFLLYPFRGNLQRASPVFAILFLTLRVVSVQEQTLSIDLLNKLTH